MNRSLKRILTIALGLSSFILYNYIANSSLGASQIAPSNKKNVKVVAQGGTLDERVEGVSTSKRIAEHYSIDVIGDEMYAHFRGNDFKIVKIANLPARIYTGDAPVITTLDGMLYHLNHEYNPNFQIKGDRLARLKHLFYLLRNNPDLENLKGVNLEFNHPPRVDSSLQAGKTYYFPVYKLK
jgi:hypothetical protein